MSQTFYEQLKALFFNVGNVQMTQEEIEKCSKLLREMSSVFQSKTTAFNNDEIDASEKMNKYFGFKYDTFYSVQTPNDVQELVTTIGNQSSFKLLELNTAVFDARLDENQFTDVGLVNLYCSYEYRDLPMRVFIEDNRINEFLQQKSRK